MRRIAVFSLTLLVLAGCASEPMPQVVYDYETTAESRPVISNPSPATTNPAPSQPSTTGLVPSEWIPSRPDRAWSAIIIHHSATAEGSAAIFDKWHRESKHWDGVGYDFVIGNGTDSADGEVEPTYRWRGQLIGAHCGGTPGNWANTEGIGICLVGDFNNNMPTRRQMESLIRLTRFLQYRYKIPKSRIYGHGTTPGAHITDCPGQHFPMSAFKAALPY